jgi:hypothetical protein
MPSEAPETQGETAQPAPRPKAEETPEDPDRPKRAGWWQRRGFF